jgi:argininosuccinate lyase
MPQKRNPDAAELVRGKTGRVIGSLTTLLTCLKGLPLAYSKDMQEDKEPVFDADETLAICIAAAAGMIRDMTVNIDALRHAAHVGFTTATDLADWLVRRLALPFREAHHIAGRMVRLAEEKGCDLGALTLAEIHTIEPRLTADALAVLTVERSVESRASLGGTAPLRIREAIAKAKDRFL